MLAVLLALKMEEEPVGHRHGQPLEKQGSALVPRASRREHSLLTP